MDKSKLGEKFFKGICIVGFTTMMVSFLYSCKTRDNFIKQKDIIIQQLQDEVTRLEKIQTNHKIEINQYESVFNEYDEECNRLENILSGLQLEAIEGIDSTSKQHLCQLVEAEATGYGYLHKLAIANVVLNRKISKYYPNTIMGVIHQYNKLKNGKIVFHFSCVGDMRFYQVPISKSTLKAVEDALNGIDNSEGATIFFNPKHSNPKFVSQLRNNTIKLYEHDCHEFRKEK